MPKPGPKEFRDDVGPVARRRGSGTTRKQITADFGISESPLTNWLAGAERDDGSARSEECGGRAESGLMRRVRLLEH
jgi:transposase